MKRKLLIACVFALTINYAKAQENPLKNGMGLSAFKDVLTVG